MDTVQSVAEHAISTYARFLAIGAPYTHLVRPPAHLEVQEGDALDEWAAAIAELAGMPANSLPDVVAKARALETCRGLAKDTIDGDQGLAFSLIRDIKALEAA